MATSDPRTSPTHTRRQAFALAGALTVTVLTGLVAAAGIVHRPAAGPPVPVVQIAGSSAAPTSTWADD